MGRGGGRAGGGAGGLTGRAPLAGGGGGSGRGSPPPRTGEAQIEIAERRGEGDGADVERRREGRQRRLEGGKGAADLAGLIGGPALVPELGRPHAALVDLQDGGIHDAVGERLQAQHLEAPGAGRNDPPAAGEVVEIFEDHPGIVEGEAVLEDQHRDLAERVLPAQGILRVGGVGHHHLDAAGEAEMVHGDLDLAAEGRSGGRAQDQHARSSERVGRRVRAAVRGRDRAGLRVRAGFGAK